MPRLPKPPGQATHRGGPGRWRTLPPAEPFKRPPPLPARKPPWRKATREWWRVVWSSPMASVYLAADVPALVRLAEMVEDRARGKLPNAGLIAMQQIEDRYGLSPKARRALQWEIAQAAPDTPVIRPDAPRLRAVPDGRARLGRAKAG